MLINRRQHDRNLKSKHSNRHNKQIYFNPHESSEWSQIKSEEQTGAKYKTRTKLNQIIGPITATATTTTRGKTKTDSYS